MTDTVESLGDPSSEPVIFLRKREHPQSKQKSERRLSFIRLGFLSTNMSPTKTVDIFIFPPSFSWILPTIVTPDLVSMTSPIEDTSNNTKTAIEANNSFTLNMVFKIE